MLFVGDKVEPLHDILVLDPFKIITLGAGNDRIGYFMDLGRRKNEFDVLWRLLQRFQKRIERSFRKHMHLVDDIDLVRCLGGLKLSALDHIPDIVDSGIGSGINLDHIQEASVLEITTVLALSARVSIFRKRETIHSLRKNACHGSLPSSTRSVEKIGPNGTVLRKRIL